MFLHIGMVPPNTWSDRAMDNEGALDCVLHNAQIKLQFLQHFSVGTDLITEDPFPLNSASCQYILQCHMHIDKHDAID